MPGEISYRIGVDENGLGAQLGPMIVTAALARVTEKGARLIGRKLPAHLKKDLDDSKALVSCHDVSLGEAWTRAVVNRNLPPGVAAPRTPDELFRFISLRSQNELEELCPKAAKPQCWTTEGEAFSATDEQLKRINGHLDYLAGRGVEVLRVRSETLCTAKLNQLKALGIHRFMADLNAMERLVLSHREEAGEPILAVLGKVGGIGSYPKFFGPLSDRLVSVLTEGQAKSCYHFPGLGELRFVRDADASDALVMLASLVGKYVRELTMARVARFYPDALGATPPSGYHDPVSMRFVEASTSARKRLGVVDNCFLRTKEEAAQKSTKPKAVARAKADALAKSQTKLF